MATAFVHVGQAGLQVAEPFWELAADHPSARSWLFDDSAHAHCLLVDCEPRVVRSVARSLRWVVRDDAAHVLRAHGSANNWAMGFGSVAPDSLDAIADSLRRMVERMDWWSGTVITHSLAGGTGSGMGSRLLLDIRDAYPRQWLVSAAVLPFPTGDSALQNYNAALAL
ncbi:Tubulin/FtsZ, GTPase domain-containing protein, partial [Pavlovales sp. CCMP2436]